ncbi:MAG: hypothetical protein GY803_17715 [Chloroflexi bacterium]|nr:hypothetical protein [Chloroflexota bacterium]
MQDEQPVKPSNILNIVATNQGRRPLTMTAPVAKRMTPEQVCMHIKAGNIVVDARSSGEFCMGHIPGAYNVQMDSQEFEQRVGWVTPLDVPIVLVANSDAEAQQAIFDMAFIALDSRVTGYLDGGMDAWMKDGRAMQNAGHVDVHSLRNCLKDKEIQILDVRDQEEWDEGHIKDAKHMVYTDIPTQAANLDLDPKSPIAVICATGKRSSTVVSILIQEGFRDLYNVTGGIEAWINAKFPVVDQFGNVCKF